MRHLKDQKAFQRKPGQTGVDYNCLHCCFVAGMGDCKILVGTVVVDIFVGVRCCKG